MKSPLDKEIELLDRELLVMGTLCEEALTLAETALRGERNDIARIDKLEETIDQKERTIETHCLRLLLRRQPVACDLRRISAVLKAITDLERIGDQASDIAEILSERSGAFSIPCDRVSAMGETVRTMVEDAVTALVNCDAKLAQDVCNRDDEADRMFEEIRDALVAQLPLQQSGARDFVDLLMIAKYLERIGDHAVNVAQWAEFSVTGVRNGNEEL